MDGSEIVIFEYVLGTEVESISLWAMLETTNEGHKSGAISIGDDNRSGIDAKAIVQFARRMSPGIPRWEDEIA